MPTELVPGQNTPVPSETLAVTITSGKAADFSAFCLYGNNRTRKDEDFVFYGQKQNENASVMLSGSGTQFIFTFNLPQIPAHIEKVALAATSDYPVITEIGPITLTIANSAGATLVSCSPQTGNRSEAALILGEFYRRNGEWKFRFVDQGFNGGLQPLAEFYGVEIADEPKPQPKVNLSKIVLTKQKPKIDLAKHDVKGVFGVNLNWNQKSASGPTGFFKKFTGASSGVDLDLGAFVKLRNGQKYVIQALGNTFGDMDYAPYVKLLGDDRTGEQAGGEWLHINGDKLNEIEEILIYAFIYEGVPNWQQTDGVVTIHIPGQPEIETRLTEGDNRLPMCAIARIKNKGGNVAIDRLDRYFRGQRDMDEAYGWGFSWVRGSK